MIKQETIKAYTIDEHPDKDAVFNWIRANWVHLGEHAVEDFTDSLRALAREVGGKLDYAISITPDRGEFIYLEGYDKTALNALNAEDCPLTGCFYDIWTINALKEGDMMLALGALHDEGDYIYSDEGLEDMGVLDHWYFTEDGAFHS